MTETPPRPPAATPPAGYQIHPSLQNLAVSIDRIKTLPGNPRRGDVQAVAKSLARFGQRKAIVCILTKKGDKDGGLTVIAGNHTFLAATSLGWSEIAVIIVDDDDATAKAFALADNRTSDLAVNDDIELAMMLQEVHDFDVELMYSASYSEEDLTALLDQAFGGNPGLTDPDSVPDKPSIAYNTIGMVWKLGPHTLVCGDSTDPAVVSKALEGRDIDMVWTDPPYGVDYEGGNGKKIQNDAKDMEALESLLTASLGCAYDFCRKGATWYVCGPDSPPPGFVFAKVLEALGVWRINIVWVKNRFVLSRADFHHRHENIYSNIDPETGEVGGSLAVDEPEEEEEPLLHQPVHYGWKEGKHRRPPTRKIDTVWEVDRPQASKDHPCLAPDEEVLTEEGWRPISAVQMGDRVYGEDGKFHKVFDVSSHPFDGELVAVRAEATNQPTFATDNHPFLVWRPERKGAAIVGGVADWVEAGDLQVGDYTMTPVFKQRGIGRHVDPDYAWVLGLWIAEGSTLKAGHGSNEYLVFTLHEKEAPWVDRIRSAFPGANVCVYPNWMGAKSIHVMVFDDFYCKEFLRLAGKYAHGKRFSTEVLLDWGESSRREVLNGYLAGDGCQIRHQFRAKTVSRDLTASMMLLAESVGDRFACYGYPGENPKIGDRVLNGSPWWHMMFTPGEVDAGRPKWVKVGHTTYSLRRIKSLDRVPHEGEVWNLTVMDSHTFQTVAGMSHNTMKPVALVEKGLNNSSLRDDIIFDPFGGSGSMIIAAHRMGRTGVTIELDEQYCDVICKRFEAHTGITPVLVGDGPHTFLVSED